MAVVDVLNGAAGEFQFNQAIGRPTLSSYLRVNMTVGKRFSQILRRSLDVPAPHLSDEKALFDDAVRRRCGVIRDNSAEGPTSHRDCRSESEANRVYPTTLK